MDHVERRMRTRFGRRLRRWGELWSYPELAVEVSVEFSSRMTRSLGLAHPARSLIRLNRDLLRALGRRTQRGNHDSISWFAQQQILAKWKLFLHNSLSPAWIGIIPSKALLGRNRADKNGVETRIALRAESYRISVETVLQFRGGQD